MNQIDPDLSALIGSRICHDLISPLGAISNGVELMGMSQAPLTPEMELVAESVSNANIRIKFFRIAYGTASETQMVGSAEIREIFDGMNQMGRIRYHWFTEGDQKRSDVKLVFLLTQCLENALPFGGEITVRSSGRNLSLIAEGEKIRVDEDLWAIATGFSAPEDVAPATVQFALVPHELLRQGRQMSMQHTQTDLTLAI